MAELGKLSTADIVVVGCYLVLILLVGLASMLRKNKGGTEGFFLAGSTVPWWQVGASIFASNVGSMHFIGLAGTGAASGYAVVLFEWLAIWPILATAHFFLPVYLVSAVYTMPEYLSKRFCSSRIRTYFSLFGLFMKIVLGIPVDVFAGAVFLEIILGWNLYACIFLLLGITAVYTIAGGLSAVVYTETAQAILIVAGGVFVTIAGFREIGGYHNLGKRFMQAYTNDSLTTNNTCGIPPSNSLHLFRGVNDDLPALGLFTGLSVLALQYFATDQTIVQRSLAAKNLAHGQGGAILAAWLKLSPMFLMIMPGMISRILYPDIIACSDPVKCMEICQNPNGCTNIAYPLLVVNILPSGMRGLLTAVMLSALMSSLASTFNSASTIFTLDIWTKFRKIPLDHRMNSLTNTQKRRNELEIMIVGRLFILFMMVVGVLWVPIVKSGGSNGQLFTYIIKIGGATSAPILAVFVLALFWHRATEKGAFWTLVIGFLLSLVRMALEILQPGPRCGEEDHRSMFMQILMIHYMYFSAILFLAAVLLGMAISWKTEPIPEACLYRLTFWTRHSTKPRREPSSGADINGISGNGDTTTSFSEEDIPPNAQNVNIQGDDIRSRRNNHIEDQTGYDEDDLNNDDTSQLIPSDEGNPQQDSGQPERTSKFWRFTYWFLGVSTMEGDPVPEETTEERELVMQKKIVVSKRSYVLIFTNWLLVIAVHLYVYVTFG